MASPNTPPLDPRAHRAQTERRLILGFVLILYAGGGGLIWLLYSPGAALLGWACLTVGLVVAGLAWLILSAIGRWAGED